MIARPDPNCRCILTLIAARDRTTLLSLLAHVVNRFGWLCHAYCLWTITIIS